MKVGTIALIGAALAALWLLMKKTTGGVSLSGSATVGNPGATPYGPYGPTSPYPMPGGYPMPSAGTSGAQDFNQIAGGISSLINSIGGNIGNVVDAFSGGGD